MERTSWIHEQKRKEAEKRFAESKVKIMKRKEEDAKAEVSWMYDHKKEEAEEYLKGKEIKLSSSSAVVQ